MTRRLGLASLAAAIGVTGITACGSAGSGAPPGAAKAAGGSRTPTTATAMTTAAGHARPAAVPLRPLNSSLGVTAVQLATAMATDGSALDPRNVFHAATDHRVVAVLTLSGLKPGTTISFARWLNGKFVDTRTASLRAPSSHFYFEFTHAAGTTITPGTFRLRLYVNGSAAAETTYQVV